MIFFFLHRRIHVDSVLNSAKISAADLGLIQVKVSSRFSMWKPLQKVTPQPFFSILIYNIDNIMLKNLSHLNRDVDFLLKINGRQFISGFPMDFGVEYILESCEKTSV